MASLSSSGSAFLETLDYRIPHYLATTEQVNISVGDVVVVREDETIPGRWPIARVTKTYPGKDGVVRVITIETGDGKTYTRPVVKVAPLLPPPTV